MATDYALVTLGTVASTQDEARRRLLAADRPVLVVADRQVAGRGRSGRGWEQAPRALFSSLAFRPSWPRDTWSRLTLLAGLAVHGAAAGAVPAHGRDPAAAGLGLKWPNDLVGDGGKVAGVLTEVEGDTAVVGVGLNLWWPDRPGSPRPAGVAALCAADPGPGLAAELAGAWAGRFLESVGAGWDTWPRERYLERCVTVGRTVTWLPDGTGRAVDVDAGGGLVVDTTGGRVTLTAGEVREVRETAGGDGGPG